MVKWGRPWLGYAVVGDCPDTGLGESGDEFGYGTEWPACITRKFKLETCEGSRSE